MRRLALLSVAAGLFVGLALVPAVAESVELYTNRATWESTVATVRMLEDFESESLGTYMTPYITSAGINVERFGMFLDLTIRDNGAVDNSREMLIQDYGNRAYFSFPANHNQLGFGFDWETGGEAWTLKFLGQDYPLPANSSGFIGLVDAAGESFGFELTSPEATQDGLAIDNLAFSPALLVFTDRAAWEATIGVIPGTEDFEADTPGSHQTPYVTGGGCSLASLGAALDINVENSGLVDGSREIHFADYGEQVEFSFPGGTIQPSFGFDWEAPQESWSLIVRGEQMGLYGTGSGFIGIIDQSGTNDSFILSSTTVVQQGIHIDNLSYSEATVPAMTTTWGLIKNRYR